MEKPIAALGIDPGKTGALVLLSEKKMGVHNFKNIESAKIAIEKINESYDIKFAILEKVWIRYGEKDVKSAEVLIRNSEMWHTLLHFFEIEHREYAPSQWRKGLIVKRDQHGKGIYIETAKKLMPEHAHMFTRHDKAEAALMAWRAWMQIKNT